MTAQRFTPHQQLQHALPVLQAQRLLLLNLVLTAANALVNKLPDSAHEGLQGAQSSFKPRLVHPKQAIWTGGSGQTLHAQFLWLKYAENNLELLIHVCFLRVSPTACV